MSIDVTMHDPQLRDGGLGIYRSEHTGTLVIGLKASDHRYSANATIFISDENFDAIVNAVNAFRASENHSYAVCGPYCPDVPQDDDEQRYPTWMEQGPGTENP